MIFLHFMIIIHLYIKFVWLLVVL